jgi:hypothetical protein
MSTKLKAGTATSGAVIDADTTGILELQSGSTPTTAVTVDASQNVGIGTSSPARRLDVRGSLGMQVNEDAVGTKVISIRSDFASAGPAINVTTNDPLLFLTNNAERMRIDSSGNLLLGTTSGYGTGASPHFYVSANTAGKYVAVLKNANATPGCLALDLSADPNNSSDTFIATIQNRFNVRSNGGIANYSANNVNLSDAREKTNIELAGSYLNKICAIPVKTFNYIDQNRDEDDGLTLGVIAQDVQTVAPELVMESNWGTEEIPKMRLSIYQTDLQYALMKCIQEQQALITDLTTRLSALEAK